MILPRATEVISRSADLVARQYYGSRRCNYYGNSYRCNSAWNRWGRWVLAGVLIFAGLVLLLIFLCCARRRKRRQARYAAPVAMQTPHINNGGYNNQSYNAPPGPPPTYGGENYGYYGQQNGVAQPANVYKPH